MNKTLNKFSNWVPWPTRKTFIDEGILSQSGVYMIACAASDSVILQGKPNIRAPLIYIGETSGRKLRDRLNEFDRSAFRGLVAHSGGKTFHKTFKATLKPSRIYVSVLPVSLEDKAQRTAYIRYVERMLIWEYVRVHPVLPACNNK